MNDSLISLAKSNLKLAVEPTPYIRSFLQVTFFSEKKKENYTFLLKQFFFKKRKYKNFYKYNSKMNDMQYECI